MKIQMRKQGRDRKKLKQRKGHQTQERPCRHVTLRHFRLTTAVVENQ
jgi:hypothetical protein